MCGASDPVPSAGPQVRICIVAHFAYGALVGGESGQIGGVERQTTLMARWLADKGHSVSMLTWDEGQPDGLLVDGVRVVKTCARHEGLPGLRFFHPRWSRLARAMARADADVYYQNCAEAATGQVAEWCVRHKRRFVYSVASDADCDPGLRHMKRRERVLYRFGLRRADRIIVQTRRQKEMLRAGFGVDSSVIPMPCPGPGADFRFPLPPVLSEKRVLWLARVVRLKRPEWVIELARMCPDVQFDLVGPHDDASLADVLLVSARGVPNLKIHGPASRDRVAEFYRGTHCLLSTSEYEGFPNTYLEAWSHGVPVVTTVDPDDIVATQGLGVAATSRESLAEGIRTLLASSTAWQRTAERCRAYYLAHHTVDGVMQTFERVFQEYAACVP